MSTEDRIEKRDFGLAASIRDLREKQERETEGRRGGTDKERMDAFLKAHPDPLPPVWQQPSRAGSYNTITRPAHYARFAIEPLDFIKANNFNFLVGNVIKYVCRYDMKNGLEDLRKAREYLDHIIAGEEKRLVRDAGEKVAGQPASDDAEHGADRRDGS